MDISCADEGPMHEDQMSFARILSQTDGRREQAHHLERWAYYIAHVLSIGPDSGWFAPSKILNLYERLLAELVLVDECT